MTNFCTHRQWQIDHIFDIKNDQAIFYALWKFSIVGYKFIILKRFWLEQYFFRWICNSVVNDFIGNWNGNYCWYENAFREWNFVTLKINKILKLGFTGFRGLLNGLQYLISSLKQWQPTNVPWRVFYCAEFLQAIF